MTGKVIYSSGGNYKVKVGDQVFDAKPLGIFRKDNTKIIVGDVVELEVNQGDELNVITKLHERKNEFIRPNISNIDYAIIVTSVKEPKLNHFYLDKLIYIFQSKDIEPILLFTKTDLGLEEDIKSILEEYRKAGYKVIESANGLTEEGVEQLKEWTKDSFVVITGQTGVGKSTTLNRIKPDLNLKTNEISEALGRGKHTTRHSEAFEVFENTLLVDTPGFSSLELTEEDKGHLPHNFMNFSDYINDCKFNDCKHINEDGCAVKDNVSERTLENYKKMMVE